MKKQHLKGLLSICLISILFLFSCGNKEKQFTVKGVVSDADSLTLYLEERGHSSVTVIDSVLLSESGEFSFQKKALNYPEFYRLRLNNQSITFSVDSTETIIVNADKANFGSKYVVENSYNSSKIKDALLLQLKFRSELQSLKESYDKKLISDQLYLEKVMAVIEVYKKDASNMVLEDYKGTVAYYLLFQRVDDILIFDPLEKKDLNLFRAVATVWDTYYPESPRSKHLKDYTLQAIAEYKAMQSKEGLIDLLSKGDAMENKDFFVVNLPSISGKKISTESFRGKLLILDFTAYSTEYSLAHNIRLNKVYEKYKSKLGIYQISLDRDKHAWQNVAVNLPWTCVRDEQSLNSSLLGKFNVSSLPSTYIVNSNGDLVKKLNQNDDIEKEVAKFL